MLDLLLIATLGVLIAVFVGALLPRKEGEAAVAGPDPDAGIWTGGRGNVALVWALVTGTLCALALAVTGLAALKAGAIGVLVGVVTHVALGILSSRRDLALELSVAAAVDLVVASLRAGAALVESISTAAAETRGPAAGILKELAERLRLGESAHSVLGDLSRRHPQEGVRLFAFALTSHFDSGGSAASSLSNVSRSIRDRADVVRRTASQAIETQASIVGIVVSTYGLAFLMWQQYPERVEGFAPSEAGSGLIGLSIVLQAIGLAWVQRMTRAEV